MLLLQQAQVQSLVRELRSCKPHGVEKEMMQVLSQTDLGSNPGFLDCDDLGQVT